MTDTKQTSAIADAPAAPPERSPTGRSGLWPYNRRRFHSTLGYRSPDETERDHHLTLVVAKAV
jgi:hypothetical protein